MKSFRQIYLSLILLATLLSGCGKDTQVSKTEIGSSDVVIAEVTNETESAAESTTNSNPTESSGARGARVNYTEGTERVWQNGPSDEDLRRGSYTLKTPKRVSGTSTVKGDNVPVLFDIPTDSKSSRTFNHGLDPEF